MSNNEQPIIIKKRKRAGHHGHHGGAWKVAYADFVTAMMCFFLVMWILGLSEPNRKRLASFFSKPGVFDIEKGSKIRMDLELTPGSDGEGGVGSGRSSYPNIDLTENEQSMSVPDSVRKVMQAMIQQDSLNQVSEKRNLLEQLEQAKQVMMQQSDDMRNVARNMVIVADDKALRIELIESRDNLFFNPGSDVPTAQAIRVLSVVSSFLSKLDHTVYIEGHTDAKQFPGSRGGYSNWDLSAGRANAARRILETTGLWAEQITGVVACADKRPINTDNPFDPINRRVTIVVPTMTQSDLLRNRLREYAEAQGFKTSSGAPSQTPAP